MSQLLTTAEFLTQWAHSRLFLERWHGQKKRKGKDSHVKIFHMNKLQEF